MCQVGLQLAVLLLIMISGVTSDITLAPENTVVMTSQSTTLHCSFNTSSLFGWRFTDVTGKVAKYVANSSCLIGAAYTGQYSTIAGSGQCDLVIPQAATYQAGTYGCFDAQLNLRAAYLMVTSPPAITSNITDVVLDQETVNLVCNISYNTTSQYATGKPNEPVLSPSATWSPCIPLSSTSVTSLTYYESSIMVQASKPEIPSCTCTISFQAPPPQSSYNSNAPSQTVSATSPSIPIMYPAVNAVITPSSVSTDGCSSGAFSCAADGYPPPAYQFLITVFGNGSMLQWNAPGNYSIQCLASNYIRGELYNSLSAIEHFQICDFQPTTLAPGVTTSTLAPGVTTSTRGVCPVNKATVIGDYSIFSALICFFAASLHYI